ncbi:MAG: polyphenol oxidase family protein [Endomicrobiia bacterium]
MVWEKSKLLITFLDKQFFLATTNKDFFKNFVLPPEIEDLNLVPCLVKEKNLILTYFLNKYDFLKPKNKILIPEQIHGNKVIFIDKNNLDLYKSVKFNNFEIYGIGSADGIITDLRDAVVLVFSADCIPLFVFNKKDMVFGLLHVGRRGLEEGICENTLLLLKARGFNLGDFRFVLGVHICEKCYIIDGKSYSLFEKLKNVFLDFGINPNRIYKEKTLCTCHTSGFFSYRKKDFIMRNISFIFSR